MVLLISEILRKLWMFEYPDGAEYFHLRARKFSSGLSPVVSLSWLGAAVYIWVFWEIMRCRLIARQGLDWAIAPCMTALQGCSDISRQIQRLIAWTFKPRWLWAGAVALLLFLGLQVVQPVTESRIYGAVFITFVIIAFALGALSFYRFLGLWIWLDKILQRLDRAKLKNAFDRLKDDVAWSPMKSFGWKIPKLTMLILSVEKLRELDTQRRVKQPFNIQDLNHGLTRVLEGEAMNDSRQEIQARRELEKLLQEVCINLQDWQSENPADQQIQDFCAIRIVAYIRYVFAHMRDSLISAFTSGFLVLIGVSTYVFEPKQLVYLGIWAALVTAVLVTIGVFVHMDRNSTLSHIAGTTAGKVEVNRQFVSNVFTYGVLPLIGLVASQFPEVSRWVVGLLNPLMNVVGVDAGAGS